MASYWVLLWRRADQGPEKPHQRGIDGMLERLAPGDRLLVSELSRLGRSLGQVIHIVDELVKRKIRFTAIKESIHFEGKQDLQTKVMVALFGLFAEVERDLISERTREGLASAGAKGRLLGRPKGLLEKSRLDGKEEEIRILLQKQVSKASIAKIVGVTRPTIYRFIRQGGYAQILKGYFYTNLVGTPRRSHCHASRRHLRLCFLSGRGKRPLCLFDRQSLSLWWI
jgi:DNA invertase Pin-like site-specific DNA recombinase